MKTNGLSQTTLKWVACITMLIDHIGIVFFPGQEIYRIIGRLAFPLFAFFIYQGCLYTRNICRYLARIFGLGIICLIGYYITEGIVYGNILMTFSCSILLITSVKHLVELVAQVKNDEAGLHHLLSGMLLVIVSILVVLMAQHLIGLDYGIAGALTPVIPYIVHISLKDRPHKSIWTLVSFGLAQLIVTVNMGGIQFFSLLALPLLLISSHQRENRRGRLLFYLFYPAHLVAIEFVRLLIERI